MIITFNREHFVVCGGIAVILESLYWKKVLNAGLNRDCDEGSWEAYLSEIRESHLISQNYNYWNTLHYL